MAITTSSGVRRTTLSLGLTLALICAASCSRDGSTIVVGSKNFTENVFLGELVAQQIEAKTDLTVERRLNLGGTFLCHQALLSGGIDVYPEYTGTALIAVLERPVERDAARVLEAVSKAYTEQFNAAWMPPFGFNNTFAIVVRGDEAQRNGWKAISDLQPAAPKLTLGFNFEFYERQDGYRGMIETYTLSFAGQPKTMDLGLLYQAMQNNQIDVAVGNSTDGLISALGLVVLEDDRHYFPPYDAAAVVRAATMQEHPEVRDALEELGGLLSESEMREINYRIDGEQAPVADVVREWRARAGL